MEIYVGSARQDENKQYSGGQAGDQKQVSANDYAGEVSMQLFYKHSKGWYIIRPKCIVHANKIAERMVTACNNPNIGYDQSNRLGIITAGIDTKTPTEADCSSLVRQCVREATGIDAGNFTTANAATLLENTGLFEAKVIFDKQSTTPVFDGDILVTRSKGHIVVVVSGNPRSLKEKSLYYPIYDGDRDSIVDALGAVGEKNTSKTNRMRIAHANGIKNYTGTAEQNMKLMVKLKNGALLRP